MTLRILFALTFWPSFLIFFLLLTTPVLKLTSKLQLIPDLQSYKLFQPFFGFYNYFFSAGMYYSSLAAIINLILSLVLMGILGALLFLLVTPGLNLLFSESIPLNFSGIDYAFKKSSHHGDSLWPTLILVSLMFSTGFLIAGSILEQTQNLQLYIYLKGLIYIICLWLWALFIWSLFSADWFLKNS